MTQHQTKAFTLVELIVVITILAILGTIAFISLQGYSKSARDSTRVSDVNTIESSLELFALQGGYYPEPSDTTDVVFSGAQVWTQGTVGDSVSSLVQRLNKKPTDPLSGTEYTYSRLNTKGEIEIAAVLEDGDISQVSNTYAGNLEGSAYVEGNYNGAVAKVSTGSNLYVLAVPTIISGDISVTDYTSLIDQGELVFNGGEVLPASYDGSTFKTDTTSITGMSTGSIVIYNSGSSLPTNQSELNTFIANLQTAYSGSSVADSGNIAAIVAETDTNNLTVLAEAMVENMGSENIEVTLVTYSCDTNPGYTNTSYSIGLPNQANESWQNTNNANACYYECTGGYIGNDCSIVNEYVTCSNQGDILSSSTTYGSCNSPDIVVCTGLGSGYTLSSCNVGTNISGVGSSSYGDYFQFGRNQSYEDGTWTNGSTTYTYDWESPGGHDNGSARYWGVEAIEMDSASFLNQNSSDQLKMKGPCEIGYHIPTKFEWTEVVNAGSWSNNSSGMSTTLKLPFAGRRDFEDSTLKNQADRGRYWSSSPYSTNSYHLYFTSTAAYPHVDNPRTSGFSVRCFKDY